MNISYNWLKQYIDIDLPAEEVSKILTSIGLEVEGVETFETVKGGLEGFVIGEVKTCAKHPNADKLSVTTVDVGLAILNVVCRTESGSCHRWNNHIQRR
jgi:phenylalanyl-tRNA synthetase beta chain